MLLTALKTHLAALVIISGIDTAQLPGLSPEVSAILNDLAAAENPSMSVALARAQPLAAAGDKDAHYLIAHWSLMTSATPDQAALLHHYRAAGSKGHIAAKCELAQVLIQAFPHDGNRLTEAVTLLQEADAAAHPIARRILAHLLISGSAAPILPADRIKGRAILEQASAAGDGGATLDLSCLYATAPAQFPCDPLKSQQLLLTSITQGSTAAMNLHAALLIAGHQPPLNPLIKRNPSAALDLLRRSSAKDSAAAWRLLGAMHEYSLERSPGNLKEALRCYPTAAALGDPKDHFRLARALDGWPDGLTSVLNSDAAAALNHYQIAADNGLAEALYEVGIHHELGKVAAKDVSKAFTCFLRSAVAGSPSAQHRLATLYHNGQGTPQDFVAAQSWYEQAADQAYVQSQVALGMLYESGALGVSRPADAAVQYAKAANAGNPLAMLHLARLYSHGSLSPDNNPDLPRALACSEQAVACSASAEPAVRFRDQLKARMSPDQIAQAQSLFNDKRISPWSSNAGPHSAEQSSPKGNTSDHPRAVDISRCFARWDAIAGDSDTFHTLPRLRLIATPADTDRSTAASSEWKRNLFEGPTPITDLLRVLTTSQH